MRRTSRPIKHLALKRPISLTPEGLRKGSRSRRTAFSGWATHKNGPLKQQMIATDIWEIQKSSSKDILRLNIDIYTYDFLAGLGVFGIDNNH